MSTRMLLSGMFALAACGGSQKPAGPPPPTCAQLGPASDIAVADLNRDGKLGAEAAARLTADMRQQVEAICTEDAWAPASIQCLLDAKAMPALEACAGQLPGPQRDRFTHAMSTLVAGAMPPPPPVAPTGTTTVPECDAFLAEVQAFLTCDELPPSARDGMRQAIPQMEQAWGMLRDPSTPPEARKAAADGCTQGREALKQSMTAAGCAP